MTTNLNNTSLIPVLPADTNRNILSFLDNRTALALPGINRTWRDNLDVQERVEQATRGMLIEQRFPTVYAAAFQSAGNPIHRLPHCDLRNQTSASTSVTESSPLIFRGELAIDSPFVLIRIKGRRTTEASYPTGPLFLSPEKILARNVKGHIVIWKKYRNSDRYYAIATSPLEDILKERHNIQANHEGVMGCDDCPFINAKIPAFLLHGLLSDLDPDFEVK